MHTFLTWRTLTALLLLAWLAACRSAPPTAGANGALRVVATTTIVGDVVQQVGGERVEVTVLLPAGVDTHSYEPAPQDIARVHEAALIFANGFGLETFLEPLLESAGAQERVVIVSEGIPPRQHPAEGEHSGEEFDPHVWMDPNNVMVWVGNIAAALQQADPANAAGYTANAEAYQAQLAGLDAWVQEQVAAIPPDRRVIVTDHELLGYFADRYGFQQVGALIPGFSSLAEPSAGEIARLEDTIRAMKVPAILVGDTVNPALAERVASDTGTRLVTFYTESLSPPDGPAATYLDYLRYNVTAIVEVLK